MNSIVSRISSPVKREGSESNILLLLLGFASSVIVTRLYLEFTNYPQIGFSNFHVAHVLWGGLFLFAASLLPLIYSNRWAYRAGALLSGVGVGLFIDEVGKFITRNNDYFYPGAAPIIYAFFILTVLVYVRVRKPATDDPRTELYHALDALEEILDHDLDVKEHEELISRLELIKSTKKHPEYARLAQDLLDFLESDKIKLAEDTPTTLEKTLQKLQDLEEHVLGRRLHKAILIIGISFFAFQALQDIYVITRVFVSSDYLLKVVNDLMTSGKITSNSSLPWFFAMIFLQAGIGTLYVISALLFIIGKEKRAVALAYFAILISLTTVDLLVFYFDQFRAIIGSLIELGFLLGIIRYRQLYLFPSFKKRLK